jgi:transcriptional regulator with XRE-family HTH domain
VIKRLREAKGFTQAELARKVRVTRPYVTMLESGARKTAPLAMLKRLARALEVPMTVLTEGRMVSRLGEDPLAPFGFQKGDRVAPRRADGSADLRYAGVVTDGICWYQLPAGSYTDLYQVRREDGLYFDARGPELARLP